MKDAGSAREQLDGIAPVAPEVWWRLQAYAGHLQHWQKTLNLVAPSTLLHIWQRHILDSWQLVPLIPGDGGDIADLGSGAGFPGMVLAISGIKQVHLVESNHRKAAFLRFVAEQTETACQVHAVRAETLSRPEIGEVSVITARALASLTALLELSLPLCGPDSRLIFPKGRRWQDEVREAEQMYHFDFTAHESVTDPEAVILELRHLTKR